MNFDKLSILNKVYNSIKDFSTPKGYILPNDYPIKLTEREIEYLNKVFNHNENVAKIIPPIRYEKPIEVKTKREML